MLCRGSVIHIGASKDGFSFDPYMYACIRVYLVCTFSRSFATDLFIKTIMVKGQYSTLCKLQFVRCFTSTYMAQNGLQNDPISFFRCM